MYTRPDLNRTDLEKGYTDFVLSTEPEIGVAGAAWKPTLSIRRETSYVQEWLKLRWCERFAHRARGQPDDPEAVPADVSSSVSGRR
ncbi:hypothetical protein [Streptomyces sp. NPDC050564]|uniref:hypothetical protein n=1 Tax=Streptomyces sp. NPDC050564 TaxID=3365631 RepID=UPI00379D8DC8